MKWLEAAGVLAGLLAWCCGGYMVVVMLPYWIADGVRWLWHRFARVPALAAAHRGRHVARR